MAYTSLKNIYYTNPDTYEAMYLQRLQSPYVHHFPIPIQEYHRTKGYPAFLGYPEELVLLLDAIMRQNRELTQLIEQCPPAMIRQYMLSCMIDEIQATNDIEGVKSTKREIQSVLEHRPPAPAYRHLISMVDKYQKILRRETIHFETILDIRAFYDNFVRAEIKQEHPESLPDGLLFRKEKVQIVTKTGKVIHEGLYPEQTILTYLQHALSILHDPAIPLLIRLSVFHYFFEYIHPFYDGNGRTGRFILSYYLSEDLSPVIAFQLSVIISREKNTYYKLFSDTNSEWNRGELTPFVLGFLQLIAEAHNASLRKLQKTQTHLSRLRQQIAEKLHPSDEVSYTLYQELLESSLFVGSGCTMEELAAAIHKNRLTIKKRLAQIPDGYLIIDTERKPYHYKLNLSLLENKPG